MPQPTSPLLYEIYTRQWLTGLSRSTGREIDLWAVPEVELDRIAALGVTHVWLMGLWPTGGKARAEALKHPELRKAYEEALPGFVDDDIGGSPYAISAYSVPPSIGGDDGLKALRGRLAERGIKLILDFIPNHTGVDHSWAIQRPNLYVGAPVDSDVRIAEATRIRGIYGERVIAHGKDPYFAGWTDTLQLDWRRPETRKAMLEQLQKIADKCDGVRCDMAMLILNDVFAKTWAHVPAIDAHGQPVSPPADEFWWTAIAAVKAAHPGFVFLAEAYWDLEDSLCDLGFDWAYDKTLYDLVVHGNAAANGHLRRLGDRNARRAHFIENHDEPRAAVAIDPRRHAAAALLTLALPGLRFLHDGELEGRRRFARIQLVRRADEAVDVDIADLWQRTLTAVNDSAVGRGDWSLVEAAPAWDDNGSNAAFSIISWQRRGVADAFDVVVVNHAAARSQCWAKLDAQGLGQGRWVLRDALGTEVYERDGHELVDKGLYLDVAAHAAQLFRFTRV
ncbi:MAG TPA: alpha-amylase family glycosyl hydrolase [Myxococcota bacterium]